MKRLKWSFGRSTLGVRARLTLWFVLVAVGAVVLGGAVVYSIGLASIQSTLGQTFCQIAERVAGQFDERIHSETAYLSKVATDALTTEVALEAEYRNRNRPPSWIAARLERLTREWGTASGSGAHESARREVLHPQLSRRFGVLAGLRDKIIRRIATYDTHGLLVSASTPPPAVSVAGEAWFARVRREEGHFVYLALDGDRRLIALVTPIWAGVDVVGYVRSEIMLSGLAKTVRDVRFGQTGEAGLVDEVGATLVGARRDAYGEALVGRPDGARRQPSAVPYWVTTEAENRWSIWRRLVCVAPIRAVNRHRARFGLGSWAIVVTQAPGESYAALRRSLGYFALAGVLGVIVAGGGGAFMAWRIASPITRLRDGVRRFSLGERESLSNIRGQDEIGELAEEFDRMAARVRATENELRAFALAVAEAGDAIVMTDRSGAIYYANVAFERVTGYRLGEIRGGDPSILRSDKTPESAIEAMRQAALDGKAWRGETWNRRKDGADYPAEITLSPIHDESGVCTAFIGIHRDITLAHQHQERLEREVEARTREIRETEGLRVMGRMASMIAHDLRNSLSTIKMNLQMLLRRHEGGSDVEREQCRMGLDQVRFMEEILRDMLIYARPEEIQGDWLNADELINEALAAFAGVCAEQGVVVVLDGDVRLPKIYGDRVKLLQILRNLIQNAVIAMPDGGTLTLATHLAISDPEPMIVITISDTGGGIPKEVLEHIFEPFFTTHARGSGLGLAIVKRLVDQHHGSITIDSSQGQGTTATLILPTQLNT